MTHREIKPLFSPVIYPVATKNGITTFAQAIYYNSNEQQPKPKSGKPSTTQPKVAWDTLNWAPTASPPEWGAPPSVSNSAKWPWDIFAQDEKLIGKAGVRLNWQAKLMPVTKSRFQQAIPAAAAEREFKMAENMTLAWPLFDKMVTH